MDIGTLLAAMIPLGILIYWFTDLVKDVTNRNWNGLLTRAVAVGASFLAIVFYAHSSINLGGDLGETGHDLISQLGWVDQLLLSLVFAATAGTGNDVLRTFNHNDYTVKESIIPPPQVSLPAPTPAATKVSK
jgi:hypothetical protein